MLLSEGRRVVGGRDKQTKIKDEERNMATERRRGVGGEGWGVKPKTKNVERKNNNKETDTGQTPDHGLLTWTHQLGSEQT